ncbi:MAG: hypothetical protein DIU60_001020 [Actinomycetes bacterium]
MAVISIRRATPWLASVCPNASAADLVAEASVAAWGKLRGFAAYGAAAKAALSLSAGISGESAFDATRPMTAHGAQRLVPAGRVRGPHSWRDPVPIC